MPTFDEDDRFRRDWNRLSSDEQDQFMIAVRKLVHDLRLGKIRSGLRVKPYRRKPGVWEMTWADDGRALFRYGDPILRVIDT